MSLRVLKIFTIILPTLIIGGFEYFRHEFMLHYLSMEAGNIYITLITLILSYLFASWMFRSIERSNAKLAQEEAKRAVYEERERLARELHDNLAQTLFFLNVKLKKGHLEEAKAAVSEIDNSLRQAIFNLRTPPEEGAAFPVRLRKWLRDWEQMTGIPLQMDVSVPEDAFSPGDEVQVFGIIQEAFTNIRKHSKAHHAWIELRVEASEWRLRIADDGCGLETQSDSRKQYGISMMINRALELGASWDMRAGDGGRGTELLITGTRRLTS